MWQVIRAPLVPMGSFTAWTRTSSPSLSKSWICARCLPLPLRFSPLPSAAVLALQGLAVAVGAAVTLLLLAGWTGTLAAPPAAAATPAPAPAALRGPRGADRLERRARRLRAPVERPGLEPREGPRGASAPAAGDSAACAARRPALPRQRYARRRPRPAPPLRRPRPRRRWLRRGAARRSPTARRKERLRRLARAPAVGRPVRQHLPAGPASRPRPTRCWFRRRRPLLPLAEAAGSRRPGAERNPRRARAGPRPRGESPSTEPALMSISSEKPGKLGSETMSPTYRKAALSKPMSTNAACMPGSTRTTFPL